jgi:hypothetical protein
VVFFREVALLGFEQDVDGDVLWVSLRPGANDLEALDAGLAGAAVVEVLNVHDLEAGLAHETLRIEVGIGRQAGGGYACGTVGMRVEAAPGVGVDVEFDLPDA